MENTPPPAASSSLPWPPGTIKLTDDGGETKVFHHPKPTDDYDDPLNWSWRRKLLHSFIIFTYVSISFAFLDMDEIAEELLQQELNVTKTHSAMVMALKYTGLGIGGLVLTPLAYKLGRRPIYIASVAIQLIVSIWLLNIQTGTQHIVAKVMGAAGVAVAQTVVPMTIVDLFFIHRFAQMYGWFLFAQGLGAFLGPVPAGFLVMHYGWRSMWWWTTGLLGITLILVVFFLEESTFVPNTQSQSENMMFRHQQHQQQQQQQQQQKFHLQSEFNDNNNIVEVEHLDLVDLNRQLPGRTLDLPPCPRSLRQTFAFITKTHRPITKRFLAPFIILFTFPAVAYAAVTYGAVMVWLALFVHVSNTQLALPPYGFGPAALGLFSIAPFIGHTIGCIVVSYLNDSWVPKLAARNAGIYHPEMRLWLTTPGTVFVCIGMLIFGFGVVQKVSWVVLAVGFAMFGFGFAICLDVALAYVTDCYQNMVGDVLVAVVLLRNAFNIPLSLGIMPWLDTMGVQNVFILCAASAAVVLLIPIPLELWGKKCRQNTAPRYRHYSLAAIPPVTLDKLLDRDGKSRSSSLNHL